MMRALPCSLALLLACVCGCQVRRTSQFNPYDTNAQRDTSHPPNGSAHLFRLEEKAFGGLELTNQIRSEWLKPPRELFQLGPGDVVEIETLGENAAKNSALVGPDGRIYYGLLPGTFVWGLTLSQTRDLLETNLTKYLRNKPELTLTLKAVESKRVWILGAVQQPGVYSLGTPKTLLEAATLAGGTATFQGATEEAVDLRRSFIVRDGQLLKVDFHRLLRGGDLSQNVYLQPEDFVYFRPARSRQIYVIGAVAQPNILPYSDQSSLLSCILRCGGVVQYARVSRVAIIRGSLSQPRLAEVDFQAIVKGTERDILLEPGDIVYVPYVPYRQLAILGDRMLSEFVQTVALNEGARAVNPNASPVGISVGGAAGP